MELEKRKAIAWQRVRYDRDNLIKNAQWRIDRHLSEVRRGVSTTDDISKLDAYVEKLRQIPQKQTDPYNITWPHEIESTDTTE